LRPAIRLLAGLLLAGLALASSLPGAAPAPPRVLPAPARPEASPAREAFEARRSGVWLRAEGEVVRILRDDLEGRRHQRFILRLPDGLTVLISHNIDLAPRVPVEKGDEVEVFGRYEWNKRGGVIHWTHTDPRGRGPGGWIRHREKTYR